MSERVNRALLSSCLDQVLNNFANDVSMVFNTNDIFGAHHNVFEFSIFGCIPPWLEIVNLSNLSDSLKELISRARKLWLEV